METYKAIEILAKLTAQEFKLLKEYLSLKSTKCRPQVLLVFALLQKKKHRLPITKAELSKLSKLPQKRLDDIMNKMISPVLDFCTLESMKHQATDLDRAYYLLEFLSERNLPALYDSLYQDASHRLASFKPISPYENLSFYKYYKAAAIDEKIIKGRKLRLNFSEFVPYLDTFYLTEKVKLICESINRKTLINSEELGGIEVILEMAKRRSDIPSNYIATYLNIATLLLNKESITSASYDLLNEQIGGLEITTFSYEEVLTLHHYLINIALYKIKKGDESFIPRFKALITQMESKKLLLERGRISAPIFKTAISVGLRGNYINWVGTFFKKYATLVAGGSKDEIVAFCQAMILHAQKDYAGATLRLRTIRLSVVDIYFNIDIRKLELKICVEQGSTDECVLIARNLKDFLASKECIGVENKEEILKFADYASKLPAAYSIAEKRMAMLNKLKQEKNVAEREWLISFLNKRGEV
jgi:DNA-binding ferritin-like protein (Dps family)